MAGCQAPLLVSTIFSGVGGAGGMTAPTVIEPEQPALRKAAGDMAHPDHGDGEQENKEG